MDIFKSCWICDAIIFGHKAVVELCEFQEKIIAEVGVDVETLKR